VQPSVRTLVELGIENRSVWQAVKRAVSLTGATARRILTCRTLPAVAFGTGFVNPGDALPKTTTKELRVTRRHLIAFIALGLFSLVPIAWFLITLMQSIEAGEIRSGVHFPLTRIESFANSGFALMALAVMLLWIAATLRYRVDRLRQQVRAFGHEPEV
jgi:hypothetical protein